MIFDALKELKKALKRNHRNSTTLLQYEQLTAILLLIAVRSINPGKLFAGSESSANKDINSISDRALLSECQKLYGLVSKFCPREVEASLPEPDLNSIEIARSLLSNDLIVALADDLSSIGFTYQIFNMTARQLALDAVQKANKVISKDQLIAFTQLYTPAWVVDFLLANTLLLQLKQPAPLDARFSRWLLKSERRTDNLLNLRDLKLMDPACGAGHFLLAAFDLLFNLYIAEGSDKKEAIDHILSQNLYGADIDSKALWVASLTLLTKCLRFGIPAPDFRLNNLCWSDLSSGSINNDKQKVDVLGSISRQWLQEPHHPLGQSFHVVVTNPPYIGRKLLSRELKAALQEYYPDSHFDLCAAFVRRSLEMLAPDGRFGVITQASLLTLPSYRDIRAYLDQNYKVPMLVNCGTQVFPLATGEKIDSLLLIAESTAELTNTVHRRGALHLPAPAYPHEAISQESLTQKEAPVARSIYLKLTDKNNKAEQLEQLIASARLNESTNDKPNIFSSTSQSRKLSDDYLPDVLKQILLKSPKLSSIAEVRQGLATTNNKRFVRYSWDVDAKDLGTIWVPYSKGAGSERWFTDSNYVVKWGKDGSEIKQAVSEAYPYLKGKTAWVVKNEEFYFRPGLCFSFVNKKRLAVRRLPPDCIFDVASSAIFPNGNKDNENFLLAYLNSSLISTIATTINPTINLQVGDIKRLPLFDLSRQAQARLSHLANNCYETKSLIATIQQLNNHTESDNYSADSVDLEKTFNRITNKLQKLETQLTDYEQEIDMVLFAEIARLAALNTEAINNLKNWASEQFNNNEKSSNYTLLPSAFAGRLLTSMIGQLLSNGTGEQILIHPIIDEVTLPTLLGLSEQSVTWLETALQKNLTTYFRNSQVLDLAKLTKTPTRYLSIWLSSSNSLLFFSSQAFRNAVRLLNNGDQTLWDHSKEIIFSQDPILKRGDNKRTIITIDSSFSSGLAESASLIHRINSDLAKEVDWTSKELVDSVNQSLMCVQALA